MKGLIWDIRSSRNPVAHEQLRVAAHDEPEVARGWRRVAVADLRRFSWVAPRHDAPLRSHYERLISALARPAPQSAVECNSLIAARAILVESDRVMLLSAHQIHYELASGELAVCNHPLGPVVRAIGLTMRADWRPTPVQAQLVAAIRESARRLSQRATTVAPSARAIRRVDRGVRSGRAPSR